MTDPHDLPLDDEADALAAEYVLGVLPLDERLAAEGRIKSDSRFSNRVARWEVHFADLNDSYASAPAPDLMPVIEARIFGKPEPVKRSWWGFIAGASVAAALAVAILINMPLTTGAGPVMTASLAADTQALAFKASFVKGELTLSRLAGGDAVSGTDYELWIIVGDAPPVSLGLIKEAVSTRPLADLAPGSVLAVSLEKTGGSKTGAPDKVLLTGVVVAL